MSQGNGNHNGYNEMPVEMPVGSKEGGTSGNPLEVAVVLREVLKNLSVKDLLQCSLVNKQWNVEARTVLRDNRVCVAWIGQEKAVCQQLRSFEQVVKDMNVVPFNHLKIYDPWFHRGEGSCVEVNVSDISNVFESLLKLGWKGIEITGGGNSTKSRREHECQAMKVVSGIIEGNSGSLEELRINHLPPGGSRFFQLTSGNDEEWTLPHLKTAQLGADYVELLNFFYGGEEDAQELLSSFATSCPKLEAFETFVCPRVVSHLPDPMLKALKKLMFAPQEVSNGTWLSKLEQFRPGFVEVVVTDEYNELALESVNDDSWENWRRMIPLFQNSSHTLEKVKTDMFVAIVLTHAGLPVMTSVREFIVLVDEYCFETVESRPSDERARLLTSRMAVFFRLAPQVERVKLEIESVSLSSADPEGTFWAWLESEDVGRYFADRVNILEMEFPVEDRSRKNWEELMCPVGMIEYLPADQPQVKKLHVTGPFVSPDYLTQIYKFWPDLEELTVDHNPTKDRFSTALNFYLRPSRFQIQILLFGDDSDDDMAEHFLQLERRHYDRFCVDAALCGISVGEARGLRNQPAEFLDDYNLVPIGPSLAIFKNLGVLRLKFGNQWRFAARPTKVVGALVFNRLPQLKVYISGSVFVEREFEGMNFFHNNVHFMGIEENQGN